jgi:hypothetical protein
MCKTPHASDKAEAPHHIVISAGIRSQNVYSEQALRTTISMHEADLSTQVLV